MNDDIPAPVSGRDVFFLKDNLLNFDDIIPMNKRIVILTLCCFCMPLLCLAQHKQRQQEDTIALAKNMQDKGAYRYAVRLLNEYLEYHPNDPNALWLAGQTELWRQRFKKSLALYEKAIAVEPESDYLRMDYANTLALTGSWDEAETVLAQLEDSGIHYTAADLVHGNIAYWSGEYPAAATFAEAVLEIDTAHVVAQNLLRRAREAQAPWVHFKSVYTSDDQPVQSVTTSLRAGRYVNRYLNPSVGIHVPVFAWNGKTAGVYQFEAGNQFLFPKVGLQADLAAGMLYFQRAAATDWTTTLAVRQRIRRFSWELQAERKPYTYTISSLDTALSLRRLAGHVGWNDERGPEGRIASELNWLPGNFVYSVYGWVYTPPLKFSIFTVRLGYSYSYSDSRENSFVARKSLSEVIAAYDQPVGGMYYLFFTPEEQHVHAGLIQLNFSAPSGAWSGGIHADAGFIARAQNPYLYLNKNPSDGSLFIDRDYASEDYAPGGITVFTQLRLTEKILLSARYAYRHAWFFNTHSAGVGVKLHFWNEGK